MKNLINNTFCVLATVLVIGMNFCAVHAGVQPSGGRTERTLLPGGSVNITWTSELATAYVHLSLWDGELGVETPISRNVISSLGTYAWTIPVTVHVGKKYRFVVRDAANPLRAMFSSGFVNIGAPIGPTVSGVASATELLSVKMWPQPAKETVRLQWSTGMESTLTILNLQGGVVYSTKVDGNQTEQVVNVEQFAAGTYVVRLLAKGAIVAQDILLVSP